MLRTGTPFHLVSDPDTCPDAVLEILRQGHRRFLDGHSQHPFAAVLGCADSRLPVELQFDAGLGDLFLVRNSGTMAFTAAIGSLV